MTITMIADLTKLNRNTVDRYVQLLRKEIAQYCETPRNLLDKLNVMKVILEARKKVIKEVEVRQIKFPYLDF